MRRSAVKKAVADIVPSRAWTEAWLDADVILDSGRRSTRDEYRPSLARTCPSSTGSARRVGPAARPMWVTMGRKYSPWRWTASGSGALRVDRAAVHALVDVAQVERLRSRRRRPPRLMSAEDLPLR